MPAYPSDIQDKLDDLQALTGADRRPAEIVAIYWPSPTGVKIYSSAMYTELPWWPDLADAIETYFGDPIPITLTLIPDGTPFIDLPRAASISDDSINLTFSDLDDVFSGLLMDYGEGIRTEVFCYWPAVDLLLSMWRGMLHQPKDMNRDQVKITATSGWRAPQMLVPKRPFATSCPFIFGAFFSTQDEIDAHKGCPYNAHIGGDIGAPGFTDCPRRVKADCVERLETEMFWPGFETREDPIPNNQTKGPNLLAKAIGNESALSDPIRVIFGERHVKALYLLAFRNETDTNHPEDGFGAALFGVSEGTNLAMWEFRMMGQLVGAEHFQIRLGALGQPPSDWSPDVNSYSGTAHCYGRIQGEFDNATASDYSGSIRVLGNNEVRVYSNPSTFTEGYTTNRAWCLLHVLAHLRWGYGQDYPRFNIQSWIDAAAWCDEYVTVTDSNGNTFSGVRSTFNAEVTARAIQQQVKDICTAGRLGIPFEFEGKDVIVPLKAEDLDDPLIPLFTDEGPNRNIVYDGAKSSLSWSVISDETMTNQWTVNFDDAANGGVDTQFIFGDQAQQLRAGRAWGDRSKRVVNKSQAGYGINSAQEAARFGNSLLYLGPLDSGGILNPFSVKFTTWYSEAFNVQNYKLIKVVNAKLQSRMSSYFTSRGLEPYPDADFTFFRVMKYTRKGDLRVEIEAQQYATLDIVNSTPPDEGWIYLGWYFPHWVSRLKKSDLSTLETIEIVTEQGNEGNMANDADYVYISSDDKLVYRFSKTNWGTFDTCPWGNATAAYVESDLIVDDTYIYGGFNQAGSTPAPAALRRIHKSDFSTVDTLTIAGRKYLLSLWQDDTYLFAVTFLNSSNAEPAEIHKIDKATFSVVATVAFGTSDDPWDFGQSITASATHVYVSGNNIKKIDKSAWTFTTHDPLIRGVNSFFTALVVVGQNLWVGTIGAPHIAILDKDTLAVVNDTAFNFGPTHGPVTNLDQDDDYVYALCSDSDDGAIVKKIKISDLSIQSYTVDIYNAEPPNFMYAMDVDQTGGVAVSFGPPRDFTATVNPKHTGGFGITVVRPAVLVLFNWAPPLLHPELITGYELRDEAGTLVMPADLVYAFTATLLPGTYTYKVRATDGIVFSGYTTVTFTVSEPPITGTDLFVIDDLTLENVLDDLTVEQVTA